MQTISPRLLPRISIPDPNTPKRIVHFKNSENVSFFIKACTDMGVPRHKNFATSDLIHSSHLSASYTNIRRIIECLEVVSNSDDQYEFSVEWPQLDPSTQQFTQEEIKRSEELLAQFTIRENKRQEVIKKSQTQNESVPSVADTKKPYCTIKLSSRASIIRPSIQDLIGQQQPPTKSEIQKWREPTLPYQHPQLSTTTNTTKTTTRENNHLFLNGCNKSQQQQQNVEQKDQLCNIKKDDDDVKAVQEEEVEEVKKEYICNNSSKDESTTDVKNQDNEKDVLINNPKFLSTSLMSTATRFRSLSESPSLLQSSSSPSLSPPFLYNNENITQNGTNHSNIDSNFIQSPKLENPSGSSSPNSPSRVVSTAFVSQKPKSDSTVTPTTTSTSTTTTTTATTTTTTTTTTTVKQDVKKSEPPKQSPEERAAIIIQRAARRWLERSRQRAIAFDSAYRERIVQEIIKTEIEYLNRLAFLKDNVLKELREAIEKGQPIISNDEIRIIFSEIEIIWAYNCRLLADFQQRTKEWNQNTMISDIFLKFIGFLKVYSQYCRNYGEALNLLNECKKQPKFKAFLTKIKDLNEEIKLRGLEDYLIRPVQRIPRYSLLLRDLISHTWKSHPDYLKLEEAFKSVNEVADYMNEKKREAENMMKLAEIQEKLDGENSTILAKSYRRFVKEGEFFEVVGKSKKNPIVLYLFNDIIAVTKPSKSSGSSFFGKQKTIRLQFSSSFTLHQLKMKEYENVCGVPNALKLYSPNDSIVICTPERETLDEWIAAINAEKVEDEKHIKEQQERITSLVSEKVAETKVKLEQQFAYRTSGQFAVADIESAGGDDTAGTISDIQVKTGKMSLREKRMKLVQASRNNRLSANVGSNTNLNAYSSENLQDDKK
eukprot:gene6205-7727_t